jgi:hypothetical protein
MIRDKTYKTAMWTRRGGDTGTKQDEPEPAKTTQLTGSFLSLTATTLDPNANSHFNNEALAKLFGLSMTDETPAQGSQPMTLPSAGDGRPEEGSARMWEPADLAGAVSVSAGGFAGQGVSIHQLQPLGVKVAAVAGETTQGMEKLGIKHTAAKRERLSHGRPSNPSVTPLSPSPSPTPLLIFVCVY